MIFHDYCINNVLTNRTLNTTTSCNTDRTERSLLKPGLIITKDRSIPVCSTKSYRLIHRNQYMYKSIT